jgi:hypothetical protein
MSIKRCGVCNNIIGEDDDFEKGVDNPDLCELCNEVAQMKRDHEDDE